MRKIKVIDVTLRDGGCVIDFNFGQNDMDTILGLLNQSRVDIIELGYLDAEKGTEHERTQFVNEQAVRKNFLKSKQQGIEYVVMFDYGTFDVNTLQPHTDSDIDGIRLAFHKKDANNIVSIGKMILERGYKLFIQPMLTLRYSDSELLELIDVVNHMLPDASGFYIVDSFGEMRHNDVIRAMNLVDHNLRKGMPMGFHSHNNLQMSYANAISVMQFPTTRDLFIDSSIMGMGKGAGNLNTELLLEHLNLYYYGNYEIAPLLGAIDTTLNRIKAEHYWGYSAEYYLSATSRCTPSYAQHFHLKHMLPINQISELLGKIQEDKKISFDAAYADAIYHEYLTNDVDDKEVVAKLHGIFSEKTVLLLAPGRSGETEKDKIYNYVQDNNVIVITVNTTHAHIFADYVFISNRKRYKSFDENSQINEKTKLICTSNIDTVDGRDTYVVNYRDYICEDRTIETNAGMMALNFLQKLNVEEVVLAGFDGFGYHKHRDDVPSEPLTFAQYEELNRAIGAHIRKISESIKMSFLTKSIYNSEF